MHLFYQDRLGTNIGKAEKRVAFFAGHRAGEGLRPDRCDHESRFFGWCVCVCVCVCVMASDIICQDKLRTEITGGRPKRKKTRGRFSVRLLFVCVLCGLIRAGTTVKPPCRSVCIGRETRLFAPFIIFKNDDFTKTGSGQTEEKRSKKGAFLQSISASWRSRTLCPCLTPPPPRTCRPTSRTATRSCRRPIRCETHLF